MASPGEGELPLPPHPSLHLMVGLARGLVPIEDAAGPPISVGVLGAGWAPACAGERVYGGGPCIGNTGNALGGGGHRAYAGGHRVHLHVQARGKRMHPPTGVRAPVGERGQGWVPAGRQLEPRWKNNSIPAPAAEAAWAPAKALA